MFYKSALGAFIPFKDDPIMTTKIKLFNTIDPCSLDGHYMLAPQVMIPDVMDVVDLLIFSSTAHASQERLRPYCQL
jgi:hypothetical protein